MPDDRGADERRLVTGALRALGVLTLPVVAGGGLLAGPPGAIGAVAGLTMVAVLFAGSAALLHRTSQRRPGRAVGIMVGGAAARLTFYVVSLAVLAQFDGIHRPALAAATAIAVAVTLTYELRLLSRMPRLFWVDLHARPDAPTPTRSPSL